MEVFFASGCRSKLARPVDLRHVVSREHSTVLAPEHSEDQHDEEDQEHNITHCFLFRSRWLCCSLLALSLREQEVRIGY
jgi:hypothetical protein